MVELPVHDGDCDEPAPDRRYRYPEDVLLDVDRAELRDRLPDVHTFLSTFELPNEDTCCDGTP